MALERFQLPFIIPVDRETDDWISGDTSINLYRRYLLGSQEIIRTNFSNIFNKVNTFTFRDNYQYSNSDDDYYITPPPTYFTNVDFNNIDSNNFPNQILILFNDQNGNDDRILFYPQRARTTNGSPALKYKLKPFIFSILLNNYWYTFPVNTHKISWNGTTPATNGATAEFMGNPSVSNVFKEIIKINENSFAITLGPAFSDLTDYWSRGIIIFTKTNTGKVCMIFPSSKLVCKPKYEVSDKAYYELRGDLSYNYLCALCRGSSFRPLQYNTIPFGSVVGDKTILNPIIVNGCTEYCPDCFYVPISQYILAPNEDTILSINGEQYYYNGFIAVKIY